MTLLNRAPEFAQVMEEIASQFNYPAEEIGVYIQPVEDMRACQMTFMFHYNPNDKQEVENMSKLRSKAIVEVVNRGGYFNRIYQDVGEVVYHLPRAQGYVNYIRRLKRLFDPNWILSPGKLCF